TRDVGPIDVVKESAEMFRKTWGEQVVGNFGMGWAGLMMGISWTLFMGLLFFVFASLGMGFMAVALIPVAVLGYVALGLFISALKGIYTAALFRYASTGEPGIMDARMVENAFRHK
ncbi:MAG TPA: DUF6159 family protein, partial [Longimicrobiales bacterium]|nr:DUF6159 family protein [Longimicrobiales bacterium]